MLSEVWAVVCLFVEAYIIVGFDCFPDNVITILMDLSFFHSTG